MSGEPQQHDVEPGTPEPLEGLDDRVSDADAKAAAEALTREEFEAAWAGLGPEAAAAIAEEVARVAATEVAPPRDVEVEVVVEVDDAKPTPTRPTRPRGTLGEAVRRASPPPPPVPPPPPPAKAPESIAHPLALTESGEPDLLALSRSHERTAAPVAATPMPAPVQQVIRVVEAAPRSTLERKLLVALVVLLVAVNGYFLATRNRTVAPDPARAAEARPPAPVQTADAAAPTEVRAAAIVTPAPAPAPVPVPVPVPAPAPAPTPEAPVAIPAPVPPSDPPEPPLVIEEDVEPATPPRAPPRPRKPKPKPPRVEERKPPVPNAAPPEEPTPTPSPFDESTPPRPPPPPPRED